jgi:hypothetical protein
VEAEHQLPVQVNQGSSQHLGSSKRRRRCCLCVIWCQQVVWR